MDIKFFSWIRANWPRVEGLAGLIVLAFVASTAVASVTKLSSTNTTVLILASVLITAAIWGALRRPPRRAAGKIGFAVAINCEDVNRAAIRDDFVLALRREIREGSCGDTFDFMEIPEHVASKVIDEKDAKRLRQKCDAHFLLVGRVRRRRIGGEEKDVLNIIAVVSHAPMPGPDAKRFAQEFNELLPAQYLIRAEESFPALEFTARWAGLVAKYVIAIAAGVSNDLDYARTLFLQVRSQLSTRDQGFMIYAKIMQRLPVHLSAIAVIKAQRQLRRWYETKDRVLIEEMGGLLTEAASHNAQSLAFHLVSAVHMFLSSHDTASARKALSRIPRANRDAVWHLNSAFLHAFDGNLKKASQHYREAARLPMPNAQFDIVAQVEDFLCWAIETFPDRKQLHYCLGFINWQFKGDPDQAVTDFNLFLDSADDAQFREHKNVVREWLDEIATQEQRP